MIIFMWSINCTDCHSGTFVIYVICNMMTGVWTEPVVLDPTEKWIHYMVMRHTGAVFFIFLDFFMLTGALILTVAQASQVIIFIHFFVFLKRSDLFLQITTNLCSLLDILSY